MTGSATSTPTPGLPLRSVAALTGVFISALASGLISRSGSLALGDIRAELGIGIDGGSWLATLYCSGELMVMPFAGWFAVTFSVRRFHTLVLWTSALIALALPMVVNPQLAMAMKLVQGMAGGALVPLLMMMAMKLLPAPIRLYGLALYSLTATFVPNIAIWSVGMWSDGIEDLRWIAWQFLPAALIATALVNWGMPKEEVKWSRFASVNWLGLIAGLFALLCFGIGLAQGNRLDWFNSPLLRFCLISGALGFLVFIASEWSHPAPFIRFQLLGRRNLAVGFSAFVLMLIAMNSAAAVPMEFLAVTQGYRPLQSAPIGLIVALPQLFIGTAVAFLLYQKWIDGRALFSLGLALIGLSCLLASRLDASWTWHEFVFIQTMQAFGQPLAIIPMLFLTTSVVQPAEGPFIAGLVNCLRSLGALIAAAIIGRFDLVRDQFHQTMLIDHFGHVQNHLPLPVSNISALISAQVTALTTADKYLLLGWVALLLVPAGLLFMHVPAPGSGSNVKTEQS
ncbi:MFS transporter [Paracoccus sp. Z330]|uniref:MFS transporter n=1 Tax=Paracoccus onchidii TaxID=3017813 RepID=A0ABT4ZIB4_9RHOB|nr:MFS transporter [Paracoccus onchidii]MDB6179099.1 MFS transporter [Paracoccus onchidii]